MILYQKWLDTKITTSVKTQPYSILNQEVELLSITIEQVDLFLKILKKKFSKKILKRFFKREAGPVLESVQYKFVRKMI